MVFIVFVRITGKPIAKAIYSAMSITVESFFTQPERSVL